MNVMLCRWLKPLKDRKRVKMAQILNFRNFLFLPSLPLSFKPSPHLRFLSTLVSSSSSPRRRNVNVPPLHLRRKYNKTTTAPMVELEETTSFGTSGFNKRRAEGTDKTDFPKKNLQLKVRKLNPINTISYVQVLG
jgi:ribonuclease Z